MKRFLFFMAVILTCLAGYAQGGYNPENPGDPNPYRKLSLVASPMTGGNVHTNNGSQVGVGQPVSCYVTENQYYEFVHWLHNGEVVSTSSRYTFTMPDEDVELVAVFEHNYNPQSPGDPQETRPTHRVTLTSSPGRGGTFNNSVLRLGEGDSINVYAYPNEGYRFEEWLLDGVLVSTKNPMKVKMTDKDLNYIARFSYNPVNPADPAVNMFNPGTGEMVIDRFVTGALTNAVSTLLGDSYAYSDIQSFVLNGVVDGSDFGVMSRMSNCATLDLSRVNGITEIPSYGFSSATALTELSLPSCISSIGRYAFNGCGNLSVITCLAVIPPTISYGAFQGVDNSVVIKVPSQSVDLYKNAPGWKDFTILPADVNVYSLTVSLPADAADGRYKNMSIELLNSLNGQRYKYLITDKTGYVFGNLLSSTTYAVSVKNARNEVLGEISDLEIVDRDLTATFGSLRQPRNITLAVTTPDGTDMTRDVTVKWFDADNNLLQQGASLTGVLEQSTVSYTVTLPQEMQSRYVQPESRTITVDGQSILNCALAELGKKTLSGKICDSDGNAIGSAVITISQCLNGTYANSITVQCDQDGNYEVEVPDVPLKVTVSAGGYISGSTELPSASTGLGNVTLDKITGIKVIPSYTFRQSVANGEEIQITEWFSDDANIAYRIVDRAGNELTGCIYQSGSIILPESIALGEELSIVAYSLTDRFNDAVQPFVISSKNTYVTIPIVQHGGINVTANEDAATTNVCLLYDNAGRQTGKATFRDNVATFDNVADGQYTIVSMRKSTLLGSVMNLSALKETMLVQGSDYLLDKVNVTSGRISEVTIARIPELDETKLYYTNDKETYFMPNKSQLTIGNYVTLKAKITMKDEYADIIDAATLVVDIPDNCEFVENSIISGAGYLGYEFDGHRLSIPIQRLSDAVRFCLVPLEGGECKPNAFVRLIINNEEVMQPMGSAYFEAQNFGLSAPAKTAKTTIAIRGTATADSEVRIYDNNTLVGTTYSMPNGEWVMNVTLHKPYTSSLHNLYGEVMTRDGKRLLTQSRTVDYDQSYVDLAKVTMVYNNNNIVFDHLNNRNSATSYSYVPGTDNFTFVADFTEKNSDKVSNVVIKVLASDGSVRSIAAEYNPASQNWVARAKYSDSNRLPINATAEFDVISTTDPYCEEAFNDQCEALAKAGLHFMEEFGNNVSMNTLVDENDRFKGNLIYNGFSLGYSVELLDYNHVYEQLMYEQQFYSYEVDDDVIFYHVESTETETTYTIADRNEKLALNITFRTDTSRSRALCDVVNAIRASFNNGTFLSNFSTGAGHFLDLLGALDYLNVPGDFSTMMDNAVRYSDAFMKMDKRTLEMILAKCDNGTYRLGPTQMKLAEIDKRWLQDRASDFSDKYYKFLDDYKKALLWKIAGDIASLGIGKAIGKVSRFIENSPKIVNWYQKFISCATDAETIGNTVTNVLGISYGAIQNGVDNAIHPAFYDIDGVRDQLWNWANAECRDITQEYIKLQEQIKRGYHDCPEDEEPEDDGDKDRDDNFPAPPVTPSIDPSGYVYEAVPSNRIEGVTATAYFKQQEEDMYGDITETAVVWDAAPFGQENPLLTDKNGRYAWDVPAGMWQVRFEKEGYEAAQSEWLPVPPPQLDVNIAMTQAKQPEVKSVHAYSDGVTIEFDKFMLPSTLTFGNISITQNEQVIEGQIVTSDLELDVDGNAYCSKIEYKPSKLLADGEATVFVSKAVKSYANIGMSDDFMQDFTVEPRISEIKVERAIDVQCGSALTIRASILPATAATGKTVTVVSLNPLIADVSAENIETDKNGDISFDVSGLIIGDTGVKLTVDGYDLDVTIDVNVTNRVVDNQVATPYASIESGKVNQGTEIYLNCDTEDASIYYTVDGSCPCDVDRIKYDGTPIIATEDFTLKIMAEADGMIESDIATYTYEIGQSGIDAIDLDKEIELYPLPLNDVLNIRNGGKIINQVRIVNVRGETVIATSPNTDTAVITVGNLPQGIYIIQIMSDSKVHTKKVMK